MFLSTVSSAISLLALLASSVHAVPTPKATDYKPAKSLRNLAKLLPTSALPSPTKDQELKYVVLGLGTQNYTCLTGDENAVPDTTGALGK